MTDKILKDDLKKIPNHEKNINQHSWILIPENEHHIRFKRTVSYDEKNMFPYPYMDLGNNNNITEKTKKHNNHNSSNPINNNNSNDKAATTKKKKYHRLAHSVHVQSDIRYR